MEAEQQLLVLAASTADRRAAGQGQGRQLAQAVDWEKVREVLLVDRLLPALGPRLLELGGEQAELALQPALAESLEHARRKDALLQLVGEQARGALAAAGIRSAPLKGPLLGERIYGEPGRRLSGDIDLLVPPEQLTAAVEIVRELGYDPPDDEVDGQGLPLLHFSLVHSQHQLPPIELHWRIHWYERRFARERLLPPSPESRNDWRPAPEDELAALLLYYTRDGFTGLRQASDLGAWWDRFGPEVRSGALKETSAAYPELEPALTTALARAQSAVGLPRSLNRPDLRSRQRIAVQLASREPIFRSREQLFAEIGLIDGLLTPPGGTAAFIRRQVFPPREVIRERAEKDGEASVASPLAYGLSVLARFGIALASLVYRRRP